MTVSTNNKEIHYQTFNDEPALPEVILKADTLEVRKYLDGFTNFIQYCETPMTAAIQGDWGTGKTTAMNYIADQLQQKNQDNRHNDKNSNSDNIILYFNTWQYSQFNLGEQLAFSLIQSIFERLPEQQTNQTKRDKVKTALKNTFKVIRAFASPTLKIAADATGLNTVFTAVNAGVDNLHDAQIKEKSDASIQDIHDTSPASALAKLHDDLASYIKDLTEGESNDGQSTKIFIMIDDLDRLEPGRAVEVMEALKTFLNVPNCVFILAIDFNVVLRGVRKKYGSDFNTEKARAFFDKIIQIPFNLPVGVYNLPTYIDDYIPNEDNSHKQQYAELLQYSIGSNPRSIKRMFNTFNLTRAIHDEQNNQSDQENDRLIDTFALLCFRDGYPKVFEDMTSRGTDGNQIRDYLVQLANQLDNSEDSDEIELEVDSRKREDLKKLIDILSELLREGTHANDEDIQIARLNAALSNVAVTAVTTTTENRATTVKEIIQLKVSNGKIRILQPDNTSYKKSLVGGAKIIEATFNEEPLDVSNWSDLSFQFIKKYGALIKENNDTISDGSNPKTTTHTHFRFFQDEEEASDYIGQIRKPDGEPLRMGNFKITQLPDGGYVVANHMGNDVNLQGVASLLKADHDNNPEQETAVLELTIEKFSKATD